MGWSEAAWRVLVFHGREKAAPLQACALLKGVLLCRSLLEDFAEAASRFPEDQDIAAVQGALVGGAP